MMRNTETPRSHALRALLKWTLFLVVCAFVGRHGFRLWNQSEIPQQSLSLAGAGWLVLSAAVYAVAWLPSVWFWRRLMHALGGQVRFRDAARAYYCGHLGKYVPGKAMVLVIRSAMVKDRGCGAAVAALTAAYETLTMMASGLALGAALAPLLFREWLEFNAPASCRAIYSRPLVTAALVLSLVIVCLPLVSRLFTGIAAKASGAGALVAPQDLLIRSGLIGAGCAAFVLSWAAQGISLGLTVHAVADVPLDVRQWPMWTGAAALATSLGFAVLFAPGGLGVREGILLAILSGQPGIGPQAAVAATVLARIVSFLAEIVVSAVLFGAFRRPKPHGALP